MPWQTHHGKRIMANASWQTHHGKRMANAWHTRHLESRLIIVWIKRRTVTAEYAMLLQILRLRVTRAEHENAWQKAQNLNMQVLQLALILQRRTHQCRWSYHTPRLNTVTERRGIGSRR